MEAKNAAAREIAPAFGAFSFDYDIDRLDALADERTKEWARIGAASFLSEDEKREALGYGPRGVKDDGGDVEVGAPADGAGDGGDGANGGAWRNQPRDELGRWTDGGGAQLIQVGGFTPEQEGMTVSDFVAAYCNGSIHRKLPGQFYDSTIAEVLAEAKTGSAAARQCNKILRQDRFRK